MERQKVRITKKSEKFDWYEVGSEYTVIYDPHVGKYMALDKGGASRYILPKDVEVIS